MSGITQQIPYREIICCDKNAPWITDEINFKKAIKCKHRVYRKYIKRFRKRDMAKMITDAKNEYYTDLGKKLCGGPGQCGNKILLENFAQDYQ